MKDAAQGRESPEYDHRMVHRREFILADETATCLELPESRGPAAHFYGANAFTTEAYRPLLERLGRDFALTALDNRALWPGQPRHPGRLRCRRYADDLIRFLETRHDAPVVGIGHSMGATATLMAAFRRPDLFRRLVLIEPVFQSLRGEWLTRLLPFTWLKRFEPVRGALAARSDWPDLESAFADFRAHRAYRRFSDKRLRQLVAALLQPDQAGYRLAFSRDWEIANYLGLDCVWHELSRLRMPVRLIRGRPSFFLGEADWQRARRLVPQGEFLQADELGHLLALEDPQRVADLILAPPEGRQS